MRLDAIPTAKEAAGGGNGGDWSCGAGCGDDDQSLAKVFEVVERHEEDHVDASGRNRIFYLALPHELYPPVAHAIHRGGRSPEPGWTRLVLEKPFGIDLPSAVVGCAPSPLGPLLNNRSSSSSITS